MPTVFQILAAHLGLPSAQFSMAVHRWRQKRDEESIWWARKASGSIPLAKVFLAKLLKSGANPSDHTEAMRIVREAAEGGCAEAQQTLSACYLIGEGVPRDVDEAQKWALRAAQGGRVECWISLIEYYIDGKHCAPDERQAMHYCDLAAEAGHPEFRTALEQDLGQA